MASLIFLTIMTPIILLITLCHRALTEQIARAHTAHPYRARERKPGSRR